MTSVEKSLDEKPPEYWINGLKTPKSVNFLIFGQLRIAMMKVEPHQNTNHYK